MFDFSGDSCSVCGSVFGERDDIIVCPKCGAPHHRDCYKVGNRCAVEERHEEGFEWQPEGRGTDTSSESFRDEFQASGNYSRDSARSKPNICRNCGGRNRDEALYCAYCEAPLFGNERTSDYSHSPDGFFTVGNGEGAISDGELIEDIPVGDLKKFIGTSWYYYIPQFLYFARNLKKASINLTAFITHGLWFISRKMYLIGFSLMLVMTATNLFRTYVECRMYPEGISNYSDALADTTVFMTEHPLLVFGMMVCTAIQIAVIFFSGVFGNRMYMSHCIRKTRRLNSECTSAEQFNKRLTEAGGISVIPTISCAAVYFLITYYSSYFIYTHILG